MDHIDLIAMRNRRFMRVQVKAANPIISSKTCLRYNYNTQDLSGQTLSHELIDIVAMVALDIRRVIFDVPSNLKRHSILYPHSFDQIDIERITWDNAVASIIGDVNGVFSRV